MLAKITKFLFLSLALGLCIKQVQASNILTQNASYRADLDLRLVQIGSEGTRELGSDSVSGASTSAAAIMGAKWMLTYPSGFGLGIGYYGIFNTSASGFYDMNVLEQNREVITEQTDQGKIDHAYALLAFEYKIGENNRGGIGFHLNIGSGNAGFKQKVSYSNETDRINYYIKESVTVFEFGGTYGLYLGSNTLMEAGVYYRLVQSNLFTLSSPGVGIAISTLVSE
ncbi:MAG: hypothetical protein AB8G05_01215 [Oligoflexales bacterium]